jgi:ketosteroid isomerase-like protein
MSTAEDQVRRVLADLAEAIRDKDAAAVIALLADDEVTFDLAPPLRMEPDRTHDPAVLEEWFATWQGPIISEPHDLEVACGEDIAYAFGLRHMTGTKKDGEEVDLWFRATACLRSEDGRWRITHMHNSVPFAMDGSDTALLDLKP